MSTDSHSIQNISSKERLFEISQFKTHSILIATGLLVLWSGLLYIEIFMPQYSKQIRDFTAQLEFIPHVIMLILAFIIYKNADRENRKMLLWIIFIILGLFLNHVVFYILVYLRGSLIINNHFVVFLLDFIPHLSWILAGLIFLSRILYNILQTQNLVKILVSFLFINLIVIYLFLTSINYAFIIYSWQSISQIILSCTQLLMFDCIVLSLIYSENLGLSSFLIGFSTLVSGNLLIVYSVTSQTIHLLTYGELLWFLGLLIMTLGIWIIKNSKNYIVADWLSKINKVKNTFALWSFGTFVTGFILFFVIAYISSDISKTIFVSMPIFIMIYSIVAVMFSIFVGKKFEVPFKQLENNISELIINNSSLKVNNDFSTNEFMFLQKFILAAFKDKEEKDKVQLVLKEEEKFRKIVGQMLHDIQSPLSGLDTLIEMASGTLPEETRVSMRHAIANIGDMTKNMLSGYNKKPKCENNDEEKAVPLLVSMSLLQILSAKRFEHQDSANIKFETDFEKSGDFAFIKIHAGHFARMISNLINNAVDAVKYKPQALIQIELTATNKVLIISIKDNGPGMPEHIQELFHKGMSVSEGKDTGYGIGLTQVWDTLNKYNGKATIFASEKRGTEIVIRFPLIPTPDWIATNIKITKDDTVVVVDDDKSIHAAWDSKLKPIRQDFPNIKIEHFEKGVDAIAFLNNLNSEQKQNTLLLTDYELINQNLNGLKIIESTKMSRAILVTSHASKPDMQDRIENAGIKGLPKELTPTVPILVDKKIIPGNKKVDMVWVDDKIDFIKLLIKSYYHDLVVDTYANPEIFMEEVIQYPKDTRIILDTNYYDEITDNAFISFNGRTMAKKLHDLGFTNLILFSGEEYEDVPSYLKFVSKLDVEAKKTLHQI